MRAVSALALLASLSTVIAKPSARIKNIVVFGDSYSDVDYVWDGGLPWPDYAALYANWTRYGFARSGGTCSNEITYRPSPPVMESQIPDYKASNLSTTLNMRETLFTIWIGTNDVGIGALLTGGSPGKTVVDTTRCAVDWVRVMYGLGARNFLFMNMIPLHQAPMYSPTGYPMKFYQGPRDQAGWALFMEEVTNSGNAIGRYMLGDVARELKGAAVGLFDAYSLFNAIHTTPQNFLNGTVPFNVTGAIYSCVYEVNGGPVGGSCPPPQVTTSEARDSYLWYDELHPSEQANRLVAREIVKGVKETSQWVKWFT